MPILYDKKTKRIVSNESAEILRMLDAQADALGSNIAKDRRPALYPVGDAALCTQIDALNAQIYVAINNGAYKAGFSSDQAVYAAAFEMYFDTLAQLEARLSDRRAFLTGEHFTEADLRLFPTLYRHDPVYYVRMKLNGARILDHPHLWRWMCRVYAMDGVAEAGSLVQPMPYPQAYLHPELAEHQKGF